MLGEYEVFHGDWAKLFDAPAQFERVTAEQVRTVARDVLNVNSRTVGVLLPDPEAEEDELDADEQEAEYEDA